MPLENPDLYPARIAALFHNLRRRFDAPRAARREVEALRRAGQELADDALAAGDDSLQPHFTALRSLRNTRDHLSTSLVDSLAIDRNDYRSVALWWRPLVVIRGLCDRAIVHHQLRRCRRALDLRHEALGRYAHASSVTAVAPIERTERLQPSVGDPHSRWVHVARHEGKALGGAVWQQLHGKLVPRVSALAGLAAGWWVASTYTDSHLRSIMSAVGIGGGGTHVVSGTTYKAMNFWVPILAAAVCAYLGDRLARAIRTRYKSGSNYPIGPGSGVFDPE